MCKKKSLKKVNFVIYFKRKDISALYLVEQIDIIVISLYVIIQGTKFNTLKHCIFCLHVFIAKSISVFCAPLPNILGSCTMLTDRFIMLEPYNCEPWTVFWFHSIDQWSGFWSAAGLALLEASIHIIDSQSEWVSVCWFQYWFWLGSCHQHLSLLSAAIRFPALSVGVCCRERNIQVLNIDSTK